MWLLCLAFTAVQLLAANAQDTITTTSQPFDCFGEDTIPSPTFPPYPSLLATASKCDIFGPSPISSLAAAQSSWQKTYSSWYVNNGAAVTSWFLSLEDYQSSASTLSRCASLYTKTSAKIFNEISGSKFATNYIYSEVTSYWSSSCSASLASRRASSSRATLTTSTSRSSSSSAGSATPASITTAASTPLSTSHVTITSSSTSPPASPTSGSDRSTSFSATSPYAVALSMVAVFMTLITTTWYF